MKSLKIKKSATAGLMTAMVLTGTAGTAWAATSAFQDIQPGASTSVRQARAGTHSFKVSDCGGPVKFELRVDRKLGSDPSEGSNTAICNSGTSATIFGSIDSRTSSYRGHFMKNRSASRADLSWTYPT